MENQPQTMDEGPAAEYIGMSVAFLRKGRSEGIVGNRTPAPPHLKLGRAVKYQRADLDEWLAARRIDPANRPPEPPVSHAAIPKRARAVAARKGPKKLPLPPKQAKRRQLPRSVA